MSAVPVKVRLDLFPGDEIPCAHPEAVADAVAAAWNASVAATGGIRITHGDVATMLAGLAWTMGALMSEPPTDEMAARLAALVRWAFKAGAEARP